MASIPAPAQSQRSQNLIEHVASALKKDGAYSPQEQRQLLDALRRRFADYALQVVSPGRTEAAQVVLRMIVEGHFDEASFERIAEVSFAAYQAIGRGAPADVVEGIGLYGYRKSIPGERLAAWANGYRQLIAAKVPAEVAADLIYNAMEQGWDDSTFNSLKWALAQGSKEGFDPKDHASYLFGHMRKGGRRPGELSNAARAYFRKLARTKAKPDLPPYEGSFSRVAAEETRKIVYEAKPEEPALKIETPVQAEAPPQRPAELPPAPSVQPSQPQSPPQPEPEIPPATAPVPEAAKEPRPQDLGIVMAGLWPGLDGSARSYLGTPYVWGGSTRRGIDCSALTQNSYRENRVGIPRVSRQQFKTGEAVDAAGLRKGDLVFFNTMGVGVSHVGMVMDPQGPKFIHASSSRGVVIDTMSKNYYKTRYLGARRIVP